MGTLNHLTAGVERTENVFRLHAPERGQAWLRRLRGLRVDFRESLSHCQDGRITENEGTLDHMAELADVPGPVTVAEVFEG